MSSSAAKAEKDSGKAVIIKAAQRMKANSFFITSTFSLSYLGRACALFAAHLPFIQL
jgi:hypothetical protein